MAETVRYDARVLRSLEPGKLLRALISAALVLLSSTSVAVNAAEHKIPTEWVLVQNEDSCGMDTIYVTHDAVKIINNRLGCHLLAKAPDWKVHCFQPKEKIEWIGKMEDFSGGAMLNPYFTPTRPEVIPLRPLGTLTAKGLSYKKYGTGNGLLFVACDISIAPKGAELLVRLYNTPSVAALPLYSSTYLKGTRMAKMTAAQVNSGFTDDLRSGLRVNLATESCKKIPYRASDFEFPTNYKRLPALASVTLTGDRKSQFNEMLDNVGFMSPTGNEKQKDTSQQHH